MIELCFPFDLGQRERFRSGELIEEWAAAYPELFEARDLTITLNQRPYHFFEWLGAILLYQSMGYCSLLEKYETKSHERKFKTFCEIAPGEVVDNVLGNRTGVPDLFVYAPDHSDWFFCEIKGLNDTLQSHQIERLEELKALSKKDYVVLNFVPLIA